MTPSTENELIFFEINANIISYDGKIYHKHRLLAEGIEYRCHFRSCGSTIRIDLCHVVTKNSIEHICTDYGKILQNTYIRNKIFNLVKHTEYTPRQIYDVIQREFASDHIIYMSKKTMYMNIYKYKKIMGDIKIKHFDNDIPDVCRKTIDGDKFLLYDSGVNDLNRLLIFGTYENLVHLENSKIRHADGTFKIIPTNFQQLYILDIKINSFLQYMHI